MNNQKIEEMAKERMESLTLSELIEALTALEDDSRMAGEVLEALRKRDYGTLGILMHSWCSHYHYLELENENCHELL